MSCSEKEQHQLTRCHSSCVDSRLSSSFWCCGSYVHSCGTYVTQLNATRRFYWRERERERATKWSLLKFYWFFSCRVVGNWNIMRVAFAKNCFVFLTIFILSLNNSVICFYHTKTNFLCNFSLLQRERVRPADEALQNGLYWRSRSSPHVNK